MEPFDVRLQDGPSYLLQGLPPHAFLPGKIQVRIYIIFARFWRHFLINFTTLRSKRFVYVPDKFARFMYTVAQLASTNIGGFDIEKIMEQFRIAFHKKSVSETDFEDSDSDVELTQEELEALAQADAADAEGTVLVDSDEEVTALPNTPEVSSGDEEDKSSPKTREGSEASARSTRSRSRKRKHSDSDSVKLVIVEDEPETEPTTPKKKKGKKDDKKDKTKK